MLTQLPEATRESQLDRWGIHPQRLQTLVFRRPPEPREVDPQWGDSFEPGMGFLVVSIKGTGQSRGGVTSHRGVLHPDEYVDAGHLRDLVEGYLGFTCAEVHRVYRQGPKSAALLELRDRIDARLLELREGGANMATLAHALGFRVVGGNCHAMDRALARARSNRKESNV